MVSALYSVSRGLVSSLGRVVGSLCFRSASRHSGVEMVLANMLRKGEGGGGLPAVD